MENWLSWVGIHVISAIILRKLVDFSCCYSLVGSDLKKNNPFDNPLLYLLNLQSITCEFVISKWEFILISENVMSRF